MKKIDIKGKEYVPVNERVIAFRQEHPDWSLLTNIESMDDGVVMIRATVQDENGRVISTALAHERENASLVNRTSYIENCETSAIGRALGFLGIGVDTSIASFEEVANAINNQDAPQKKSTKKAKKKTEPKMSDVRQYNAVNDAIKLGIITGHQVKQMIQKYGYNTFKEMTYDDAESLVNIVLAMMNGEQEEEDDIID